MKYGESIFDICYLVFALGVGFYLLKNNKNEVDRLMGLAAVILGAGDACHLVPRVLNYFIASDFMMALGVGKFVTSITMTIFYIFMYYIYLKHYKLKENKQMTYLLYGLTCVRIILCLFPQNHWFENEGSVTWGILRNLPFVVMGCLMVLLYYQVHTKEPIFKNIWLYILLSFLFYIPVAVGASLLPMLGMLMLPKTICYILILVAFIKRHKVA